MLKWTNVSEVRTASIIRAMNKPRVDHRFLYNLLYFRPRIIHGSENGGSMSLCKIGPLQRDYTAPHIPEDSKLQNDCLFLQLHTALKPTRPISTIVIYVIVIEDEGRNVLVGLLVIWILGLMSQGLYPYWVLWFSLVCK
jgi:hypothetical protein